MERIDYSSFEGKKSLFARDFLKLVRAIDMTISQPDVDTGLKDLHWGSNKSKNLVPMEDSNDVTDLFIRKGKLSFVSTIDNKLYTLYFKEDVWLIKRDDLLIRFVMA